MIGDRETRIRTIFLIVLTDPLLEMLPKIKIQNLLTKDRAGLYSDH